MDWTEPIQASFLWQPLVYTERALISFALLTLGVQLSKTKPPAFDSSIT